MIATVAKRAYTAAYHAAYRAAHREEIRAYDTAYNAAHREENLAYGVAYYAAHKDAIAERKAKDQAEFTEWLRILRSVNGCEDCGTHEGHLVHHHVDPSTKKYKVSQMASHSLDSLEDELEKCVVLCRSCHKYRHDELMRADAFALVLVPLVALHLLLKDVTA